MVFNLSMVSDFYLVLDLSMVFTFLTMVFDLSMVSDFYLVFDLSMIFTFFFYHGV